MDKQLMKMGAPLARTDGARTETIRQSVIRILAEVGLPPEAMDELSVVQLALIVAQHRAEKAA